MYGRPESPARGAHTTRCEYEYCGLVQPRGVVLVSTSLSKSELHVTTAHCATGPTRLQGCDYARPSIPATLGRLVPVPPTSSAAPLTEKERPWSTWSAVSNLTPRTGELRSEGLKYGFAVSRSLTTVGHAVSKGRSFPAWRCAGC